MRRGLGFIVWAILALLWPSAILVRGTGDGNETITPAESLDDAIREYANKSRKQPHTGTVHNVSLPPKFHGIDAAVVRLRSSTFWVRGMNFSYFHIPPRIIATPYVKRIVIVFDNLNNLSSQYYQVPGYELVAPVVGFAAYDSGNSSLIGSRKLNLTLTGNPISIRFPPFPEMYRNRTVNCVAFGEDNKLFEFSNMTSPNVCSAQHQGQYSLATPFVPPPNVSKNGGNKFLKWWVVGFVGGFVVLVLLGLLVLSIHKLVVRRKIKEMEKQSDYDVPLDTFYVGRCKMPSAPMIRTQPSGVENEYVS